MAQLSPANPWNVSSLVGPEPAFTANTANKSFNAIAGNSYSVSLVSNNVTASLPDAVANPGILLAFAVAASPAHTLTVAPSVAGQTVGGAANVALAAANDVLLVSSDGANYNVLSSVTGTGVLLQTFLTSTNESASLPNSVEAGAAAYENLGNDVIDDGSGNLTLSSFMSVAGTYTVISSITLNAEGRVTAITAS